MTLKELLDHIDSDTRICVCDSFGPHTDVVSKGELRYTQVAYILDREVERIEIDNGDNSLTITLVEIDFDDIG